MRELRVAGTYPMDGNRWRRVSALKPLEAARLLGVTDVTPEEKEKAKTNNLYLFLNKGYVLLEMKAPDVPDLALLLLERMTDGEVGLKNLPTGTRAVYLHDGHYSLIETVAP